MCSRYVEDEHLRRSIEMNATHTCNAYSILNCTRLLVRVFTSTVCSTVCDIVQKELGMKLDVRSTLFGTLHASLGALASVLLCSAALRPHTMQSCAESTVQNRRDAAREE